MKWNVPKILDTNPKIFDINPKIVLDMRYTSLIKHKFWGVMT